MNEDLVKFVIPAEFILARTVPTARELVYGYQRRWIDDAGAVRVAEAALALGKDLPASVEELALLLRGEQGRVAGLIRAAAEDLSDGVGVRDCEDPSRLWLYLALAWVYECQADFVERLEVVDMLYADFGYPAEMDGFVSYMPSPPGQPAGRSGIEERWRNYLSCGASVYLARSCP